MQGQFSLAATCSIWVDFPVPWYPETKHLLLNENPDKIDDLYKYQNGGRTIPMLVYSDDDHQVNPKPNDVLKKIQSLN